MSLKMAASIGAALGILLMAVTWGGPVIGFVNGPSLLLVVMIPMALAVGFFGGGATWAALRAGLASNPEPNSGHMRVLNGLRGMVLGAGGVGMLVGLVQMLQNLEDPTMIGPAMAVALLTVFYALCLGEFFLAPMRDRLAPGMDLSGDGPDPIGVILVTSLGGLMVMAFMIAAVG
jgi:type III secretory pathway component EscS